MRPTEILDMQVDLATRLGETLFRSIIESSFMMGASTTPRQKMARLQAERLRLSQRISAGEAAVEQLRQAGDFHVPDLAEGESSHVYHSVEESASMVDTIGRIVKTAYAYRVTSDMGVLVQHAAQQLDDDDTFDASLAPTGCGIVRFDRPMPIQDVRGKRLLGHWLVWGPMGGGTLMAWFNDMSEPDDVARDLALHPDIPDTVRRAVGRWGWIGADISRLGDPLGAAMWTTSDAHARVIESEGDTPTPSQNTVRYVHALWLLLNQTVTVVEPDEAAARPARRRAGRMKIPDRVTVIRLRRSEGTARAEGESMVQWSHRWVVRGFWRWQACGEGWKDRRRIWVGPFVKGPADKPLVQSEKLYDLSR